MRTKLVLGGLGALIVLGLAVAWFFLSSAPSPVPAPVVDTAEIRPAEEQIGTSVQGRAISAFTFGTGETELLFVGGIHGGYEWNSVLLAYQLIDYLAVHRESIPANLTVTIIPSLNPDGVFSVTGKEGRFSTVDVTKDPTITASGRFNAHNVDINRNFDCNWQATSTWQGRPVSAGTASFSEPEAKALQAFVIRHKPVAVVFWHSKANAVYASACNGGILPGTLDAMNTYAFASKYSAVKSFDAYPITGDAEGWLASIGIPAITVELATHETVEWERNLAGVQALFNLYGK